MCIYEYIFLKQCLHYGVLAASLRIGYRVRWVLFSVLLIIIIVMPRALFRSVLGDNVVQLKRPTANDLKNKSKPVLLNVTDLRAHLE